MKFNTIFINIMFAAATIASLAACNKTGKTYLSAAQADADSITLVVGTFGNALHLANLNQTTGEISMIDSVATYANGSFQWIDSSDSTFYSVFSNDGDSSAVKKFKITQAGGTLHIADAGYYHPVGDSHPCYINVSPDRKWLITANYPNGSISILKIDHQGTINDDPARLLHFTGHGPDSERQANPHLHCVAFTPDNRYMAACDLGTDKIYLYPVASDIFIDESERRDIQLEPGCGPRHIIFNEKGDKGYLVTEISDQVVVLDYDGETLHPIQYVKASDAGGQGGADIHLSPDGRHLYASVRIKGDGITLFDVDSETGRLTYRETTPTDRHPRNFMVSPNGRYIVVASRDDNSLEVFSRDADSGELSPTGNKATVERPVCVKAL